MSPVRSRSAGSGAETVLRDGGLEGRVGAGDDARSEIPLLGAAQTAEAAILDYAKELRLKLEWELGYLVQKNRPGARDLEETALERSGIREGAGLVSEELAFQQRLRNRGAVDGDEWLCRAAALGVYAAGEQLFPGPCFSDEQHRNAATRGYLGGECDGIADRLALTNDM